MKFIELAPHWVSSGGEGISRKNPQTGVMEPVPERVEIGVMFDCPCGCESKCFIYVGNHPDGKPVDSGGCPVWQCEDRNFETFTVSPSIRRNKLPSGKGCQWHGFIKEGVIQHCSDARNDKGERVH